MIPEQEIQNLKEKLLSKEREIELLRAGLDELKLTHGATVKLWEAVTENYKQQASSWMESYKNLLELTKLIVHNG